MDKYLFIYLFSSDLQKRWLLQHVKEFWEIVSNLLVHSSHQADLPHGSSSVCSWRVSPIYLKQKEMLTSVRGYNWG